MEFLILIVLVLALVGGLILRRLGRQEQTAAGLPVEAHVVYTDTGAWNKVEQPLFSRRYRLTGKPDYIVETEGRVLIPIEVKPNRAARQPRRSDTMQLMAYGVLIEEKFGARPAYGLLKYRDRAFRIEFTPELRAEFFAILDEMRRARRAANVPRSHGDASRCRTCGYREACDERLI